MEILSHLRQKETPMIDLVQVKKRVEEIAGTRGFCNCCEGKGRMWVAGKIHRATYSEATICCPDCGGSGKIRLDEVSTDELLSLTHDLIVEVERLNKQLGSPYDLTVVGAQLDSSRQFVESLQREKTELKAQLIDREKTLEAIAQVKSPDDLNEAALKRVIELEAIVKEREGCAYMGPSKDCPTHGEA